jgi:hypothetical protein
VAAVPTISTGPTLASAERRDFWRLEPVVEQGLDAFIVGATACLRFAIVGFTAKRTRRSSRIRTIGSASPSARPMDSLTRREHLAPSHPRVLAPLDSVAQREIATLISEMTVAEARRVIKTWRAPRRRYSAKPDDFFSLVETASPGPYIELLARRHRSGSTTWGNEVAGKT